MEKTKQELQRQLRIAKAQNRAYRIAIALVYDKMLDACKRGKKTTYGVRTRAEKDWELYHRDYNILVCKEYATASKLHKLRKKLVTSK